MRAENDSRFHLDGSGQTLASVPQNLPFRVDRLEGPQQDCDRLIDLGFTPGEEVLVTCTAPFGDPIVVRVRGALLALRKREAAWIRVE